MSTGVLDQLEAVIDALAAEDVGVPGRDDIVRLERLRTRLEAEVSRRLDAFDTAWAWAADDQKSLADWLGAYCNIGKAAYGRAKLARQCRGMDLVRSAWQAGTITSEHVAVLARARQSAKADDRFAEFESTFVATAHDVTPEDLAAVTRQWRDALDAERQPDQTLVVQEYESRELYLSEILDGVTVGEFRLDREAGSYLRRAVDIAYDKAHKEHDPRTPAQQRADALTAICKAYVAGETGGTGVPHVLFHNDHASYDGESVGLCETDRGVRLSPETMRRICCDSEFSSITIGPDGEVLDLGRTYRNFTPAQRRALLAQYPRCVGIRCQVPSSDCELHHIQWWDNDGPTDLGNGAPVCWHDHHLVHEYGYTMTRDPITGVIDWYDPDGNHLGNVQPRVRPKPIPIRTPRRKPQRHHPSNAS